MKTTETAFHTVAQELASAFEIAKRPSGSEFYRLRDNAPAWIERAEIMHATHEAVDGPDPRLASDWIYRLSALAADFAAEHESADGARLQIGEWAAGRADISIPALYSWAADHAYNRALADEAAESFGGSGRDGFDAYAISVLQTAQALAAERVAECIVAAIETEADGRDA